MTFFSNEQTDPMQKLWPLMTQFLGHVYLYRLEGYNVCFNLQYLTSDVIIASIIPSLLWGCFRDSLHGEQGCSIIVVAVI